MFTCHDQDFVRPRNELNKVYDNFKNTGFGLLLFDFLIYGLNLRFHLASLCNLIISVLVIVQQQVRRDKKFQDEYDASENASRPSE